jgi:hypothetical protein
MQLDKELISLKPLYFDRIEDYFACAKDLQLKLSECGKDFVKKKRSLIEMILINIKTPYDILCSTFQAIWASRKENGKSYILYFFIALY